MEHASNLSGMPSDKNKNRQKLRSGQQAVIDLIQYQNQVIAQLPTGYGKTLVIDESFRILRDEGVVNRLLVIVPTTAQLDQYKDNHKLCIDIAFFKTEALNKHRNNTSSCFIITIQSLVQPIGATLVQQILQNGEWLIAVDEMHHFGMGKVWGETLKSINFKKRLCLSATPFRPNNDGIFDKPDFVKTYSRAYDEGAVKKLKGHSYEYSITLIDKDGDSLQVSTNELIEKYGQGDDLDATLVKNKMRWSPKYIGPLVYNPIDRMISESNASTVRLQALVFCVSVKHCEIVCEQIKMHYGDSIVVEWIGNGNGASKPQAESDEIIRRFLRRSKPGQDRFSERDHIDVLCNYNMAGEGIDSITVSEIIMLRGAGISNRDLQSYGRASRIIKDKADQIGNVNYDSSSDLMTRGFVGFAFMDVFENEYPLKDEQEREEYEREPSALIDWEELLNSIKIINMEFLGVRSDMGLLRTYAEELQKVPVTDIPYAEMYSNSDHPMWDRIDENVKQRRKRSEELLSEENSIEMLNQKLNGAISKLTGLVLKLQYGNQHKVEKSAAGDIKKLIYSAKRREIGVMNNKEINSIGLHYKWIQYVEKQILTDKKLPLWLA